MNNFISGDTTDIITYPFPILVNLGQGIGSMVINNDSVMMYVPKPEQQL